MKIYILTSITFLHIMTLIMRMYEIYEARTKILIFHRVKFQKLALSTLRGLSRITIAITRILPNADREQDASDTINEERVSFSPVKKTGMLMKKPPTAHTRLMDDFCRYLLLLKQRKVTERRWVSRVHDNWASYKGVAFLRVSRAGGLARTPSFPAIMIRKNAIMTSPLVPRPYLLLVTRQPPTLIACCTVYKLGRSCIKKSRIPEICDSLI